MLPPELVTNDRTEKLGGGATGGGGGPGAGGGAGGAGEDPPGLVSCSSELIFRRQAKLIAEEYSRKGKSTS